MLMTNVSCRGQIYLLIGEPGSCWSRKTDLSGCPLGIGAGVREGQTGGQAQVRGGRSVPGIWVQVLNIPTGWLQRRAR